MSDAKVLDFFEDAPHIALNQNPSTIGLSNWNEPANRNWSYRHAVEFFPFTQNISRGNNFVHPLNEDPIDISSVTVEYRNRKMQLDEYLKESHCNGFLVLQGDSIIYENYRRMQGNERHLCQSVSKTTVCAVMGGIVASGLLDPEQTVDEYFPQVASGFSGVRLQDLLDMNVALNFSEDFTDPSAEIHDYEMISGWHPERGGRRGGVLAYLSQLEYNPDFELDGVTNYLCPNTDMLVCLMEKVTGKPFTQLLEENIYQHIGAEADAYFSTDSMGTAIGSGGFIVGLRDLARYGQIYANKGVANDSTQVIPESWIADCLNSSKGTDYYLGNNYKYHNQMTSNGTAFCHLGVSGQMLYANTESKVVVVQFSTTSSPSNGDLDVGNALYGIGDAVSDLLSA